MSEDLALPSCDFDAVPPETARGVLSTQVGCSDVSKLLVCVELGAPTWMTEAARPVLGSLPGPIADWLRTAVVRARWAAGMVKVSSKEGPRSHLSYIADDCRPVAVGDRRMPAFLGIKSGLRLRPTQTEEGKAGDRLEPAIVARWLSASSEMMECETQAEALGSMLKRYPPGWKVRARNPAVEHPHGPALVDYPDAWGVTWDGETAVINAKATWYPSRDLAAPHWLQAQAEMSVCQADLAILPHGQGWLDKSRTDPVESRTVDVYRTAPHRPTVLHLYPFAEACVQWFKDLSNTI